MSERLCTMLAANRAAGRGSRKVGPARAGLRFDL